LLLLLITLALAEEPPPLPEMLLTYAAPEGNIPLSNDAITERVIAAPGEDHLVWSPGWSRWMKWWEVPELVRSISKKAKETPVLYSVDGKEKLSLTAEELAQRVRAGEVGLAWKEGMKNWVPAQELPEVRYLLWNLTGGKSTSVPPPLPEKPDTHAIPEASTPEVPPGAPTRPLGTPPENPPPTRVEQMPEMPHVIPEADPPGAEPPGGHRRRGHASSPIHFGGELRGDSIAQDLQDASGGSSSFRPQFVISAARLELEIAGPKNRAFKTEGLVELETALELPEEAVMPIPGTDELGEPAVEGGWTSGLRRAYGDLTIQDQHRLRGGLQYSLFGVTDFYEEELYFGGIETQYDVVVRAGKTPELDLGVAYSYLGERLHLDLQIANGTGTLDDNVGKAFVLRAGLSPIEGLRVDVSGRYDFQEADSARQEGMGAISAVYTSGNLQLMALALLGATSESAEVAGKETVNFSALQADIRYALPMDKLMERLVLGARYQAFFGPLDTETVWPDDWYTVGASAMGWWDGARELALGAGLAYEAFIPQNILEPIGHSVDLQARLVF
jgi:hypothetical protein